MTRARSSCFLTLPLAVIGSEADQLELLGELPARDTAGEEELAELAERRGMRRVAGHDARARALAGARVGDGDDRDGTHPRMLVRGGPRARVR